MDQRRRFCKKMNVCFRLEVGCGMRVEALLWDVALSEVAALASGS